MSYTFIEAVSNRRSYYHLSNKAVIDDSAITALIDSLLYTMPTPFNVQASRIVLLMGEHHRELWQMLTDILRKMLPDETFRSSHEKIKRAFASGRGTVLFYEDTRALNTLRERYPNYADNVSRWSEHSSAMLQFVMWTALEGFGYGASLQHYNPLIDNAIMERWKIDPAWQLIAQMPFGTPLDTPAERVQTSPPRDRRIIIDDGK